MLWTTVATFLIVHPVATSPSWPARSNVDTKKEALSPKAGQVAECSKYGFPDQVPSPTAPFTCLGINLGLGEVRSRPPPEVLFPATDTSVFLYPDKYKKKPAHKRTATNTVMEHPPSRFVWSHVTNSNSSSATRSSSTGDGDSNDQGLVARCRRLKGTSVGRARPQVDLVAVVDPSDLPVLVGPGHALLSWVRHVRRVRTITLIGGPKELRSIVQSMRKDIARYEKAPPVHFLDSRYFNHTYGAAALSAVTTEVSASLRSLDAKQQQKALSYLRASPYRRRHHRSTSVTFDPERQRRLLLSYTTRHTHNNTGDTGDVLRTTLATVTTNATTDDDRSKSIYTATGSWRRRRRLSAEMMASVCGRQEEVPEVYRTPKRENNWQQHTPSPVTPFCGALMRLHCFDLAYLLDDVVLLQANVALASDVDLLLPNRSALYFNHLPLRLLVASAPAGGPGPAELRLWTQYKKAQAKHYSSQESEAAALHTFLGTLRQVTKEAHSSSSSTGSSDNGNGDTSSSSSTSNGATGGGIVTSAQLRAWRAFKLAKSRTYHSLAEECGALSLFLATAAAASQQQEEAAKKSSSRSAQLVPGSMPTVDELRAYGAYKRLHGLNFDGDPKAEAKALHMWFKTLWGGSSGSSNRSSSTTSTSSLGTSSGMEGAPPRRMKPQLADTGSSSWSDESNLPPLVGNAPNSPASCGRLNSVKFVNGLLQGRCAIKCPGPRGARHDAGVPMVVQRDVMRGLHLAVSQAWRQPSLFVAGHACHAAGTSFTTASGGGSNGNGGGCGAGRSAAALLRHEQQQQRHEDGSSSSRLVPSDAELYYAFASCLYPQRVLDLQLSTSSSSATGVGRDFEPHASDCSEEEMTACRVKGLLLKVCPASGSPRGKQRYGTCRSRTASLA